jgi:hypothetical protein
MTVEPLVLKGKQCSLEALRDSIRRREPPLFVRGNSGAEQLPVPVFQNHAQRRIKERPGQAKGIPKEEDQTCQKQGPLFEG